MNYKGSWSYQKALNLKVFPVDVAQDVDAHSQISLQLTCIKFLNYSIMAIIQLKEAKWLPG